MASIHRRGKRFFVSFRWAGRQYLRKLDTSHENRAKQLKARLELQIEGVRQGLAVIPKEADPIEWLLSGGSRTGPAEGSTDAVRGLGELLDRYADAIPPGAIASSTKATETIHHAHLKRELGIRTSVHGLGLEALQRYVTVRKVAPTTIRKELSTLRTAWRWAFEAGIAPPPPRFEKLRFPKHAEPPPFRHAAEIRAILKADRTADPELLWESLVLTTAEVRSIVGYVRSNWPHQWFVDAWTIAAYTGARRSEIVRMRAEDVNLGRGEIFIREKKRVRTRSESLRVVQIAKALKPTLARLVNRGGLLIQYKEGADIARALSNQWDNRSKEGPWKHVRGFHVLRHSFASNLAAAGVSQGLIDSWLGHQTEEMRKRYRHFFPVEKRKAIEALG